jgi:hypothetical protein
MGNDFSFCAAKLVSFVVVGSLPSVGVDLECRKISSSEFRFERQSRLIGELLALIGDVQEFLSRVDAKERAPLQEFKARRASLGYRVERTSLRAGESSAFSLRTVTPTTGLS